MKTIPWGSSPNLYKLHSNPEKLVGYESLRTSFLPTDGQLQEMMDHYENWWDGTGEGDTVDDWNVYYVDDQIAVDVTDTINYIESGSYKFGDPKMPELRDIHTKDLQPLRDFMVEWVKKRGDSDGLVWQWMPTVNDFKEWYYD
jgi:hypothetical protein